MPGVVFGPILPELAVAQISRETFGSFSTSNPLLARDELLEKTRLAFSADAVAYTRFVEAGDDVRFAGPRVVGNTALRVIETLEGKRTTAIARALDPRHTPASLRNVCRTWRIHDRRFVGSGSQVRRFVFGPAGFSDQVRMTAYEGDRHIGYISAIFLGDRHFERPRLGELLGLQERLHGALDKLGHLFDGFGESLPTSVVLASDGRILHHDQGQGFDLERADHRSVVDWLQSMVRTLESDPRTPEVFYFGGLEARILRLSGLYHKRSYFARLSIMEPARLGRRFEQLTPRQLEVARRAAASSATLTNIAQELALSPNTVKTHMRKAYSVLGVTTRAELAKKFFPQ